MRVNQGLLWLLPGSHLSFWLVCCLPQTVLLQSVSCNINFPWSFTTYFLRSLVSDSTLDIKSSHHHSLSCPDRTTMLELRVGNRDWPLMPQIPTFLTVLVVVVLINAFQFVVYLWLISPPISWDHCADNFSVAFWIDVLSIFSLILRVFPVWSFHVLKTDTVYIFTDPAAF